MTAKMKNGRDAQPLRRQPQAARFRRRGIPGNGRIGEADVCHAPATVFEDPGGASAARVTSELY